MNKLDGLTLEKIQIVKIRKRKQVDGLFYRLNVYIHPEKNSIAVQNKLTVLSNPSCTRGSHSITKCFFFSLLLIEQKCQNRSKESKQAHDTDTTVHVNANTKHATKANAGKMCSPTHFLQ